MDNLIETMNLKDEWLEELGQRIHTETDNDLQDRRGWEEKVEVWTKLWMCEPPSDRVGPWPDSANLCVPILASASEQQHDIAYSSFFEVDDQEYVGCKPVEEADIDAAERCGRVMNWQLGSQMYEYEIEHDRLLSAWPNDGVAFKKWWWDDKKKRAVSMFASAVDVIVPYKTKPMQLENARRITHRYHLFPSEIDAAMRDGFYRVLKDKLDKELEEGVGGKPKPLTRDGVQSTDILDMSSAELGVEDAMGLAPQQSGELPHTIFERHEDLLLGEGKEMRLVPCVIWYDLTDETVLRITSREFKRKGETVVIHQFVDYHYIWSPFGFYSLGLGHFEGPLNEIANTIFNLYVDAGRVANTPFLFYQPGAGFRKREIALVPGAGVQVNDITQVRMEKVAGLDGTLAQLLGIIDRYASDLSHNTEEMRGRVQKGVREPTARGQQARLEQSHSGFGVKVRRAIKAHQREMQLLFDLNSLFLDKKVQHRVLGSSTQVAFNKSGKADFQKRMDVTVMASPLYSSRSTMRAQATEMLDVAVRLPNVAMPKADGTIANPDLLDYLTRKWLKSYGFGEAARFIKEPPKPPMAPDVEEHHWTEGVYPVPSKDDDHAVHMVSHDLFIAMTPELDEEQRVEIKKHLLVHQEYMMAATQTPRPQPFANAPQGPQGAPQGAPMQAGMDGAPVPEFGPETGAVSPEGGMM